MAERLTERERDRARSLVLAGRAHLARDHGLEQAVKEAAKQAEACVVADALKTGVAEASTAEIKEAAKQASAKAVSAWIAQRLERIALIDRFFRELTSRDLCACISQFQYSEKTEHCQECAKLLIAYFIWSKNCRCGPVPVDEREKIQWDGIGDVDSYLLEFVKVAFERMTGMSIDSSEGFDLPKWETPNVGFGWARPAYRPARSRLDTLERDIGILAFIELQRRQKKSLAAGVRRAGRVFADDPHKPLSRENIENILCGVGCRLDDWVELPDPAEELQRLVDAALEEVADRRRRRNP